MNKNSNRSRRKAAFAAALVFISNYCFAFPLSDMAASSVYADVAGETGGDKPNDTVVTTTSAANTTTQTTTAKTTTATKASTTASTTVLTTTSANSTTSCYHERFNAICLMKGSSHAIDIYVACQ